MKQEEGANITINCVHPGLIMTNLMRHSFFLMSTYMQVLSFWVIVLEFLLWTFRLRLKRECCFLSLMFWKKTLCFLLQGCFNLPPTSCGRAYPRFGTQYLLCSFCPNSLQQCWKTNWIVLKFKFIWNNTLNKCFFFQGAATTCYVGLNPQLKGVTGQYFADCNVEKTSRFARNDALAKQLWEFSEKLIKSSSKWEPKAGSSAEKRSVLILFGLMAY